MAEVTFFLKGEKCLNGIVRVMEWFNFFVPKTKSAQEIAVETYVDDEIKKRYSVEYAAFNALVEPQRETLYKKARENLGEKIFPVELLEGKRLKKRDVIAALFVLFCFTFVSGVKAQTVKEDLIGLGMRPELSAYIANILPGGSVLGNNVYLKGRNQANNADISILKVNTSDNTQINAASAKSIILSVNNTPIPAIPAIDVNGFTASLLFKSDTAPAMAPFTATMAATPVAGTNQFKVGLNIVPTAAVDTAALLPTPAVVGQRAVIVNKGPNAVRVKAGGTNTINGSAAGAYIPLATQAIVDCHAETATNWYCGNAVVPTPAGP